MKMHPGFRPLREALESAADAYEQEARRLHVLVVRGWDPLRDLEYRRLDPATSAVLSDRAGCLTAFAALSRAAAREV